MANIITEVIGLNKDGRREIIYESDISDARWIAYDLSTRSRCRNG